MADNSETLGSFKIEVAVDGANAVKTDLEKIRLGLKALETEFKSVTKEGKKLGEVLKGLKSPGVSSGGSSGSGHGTSSGGGKTIADKVSSISGFLTEFLKAAKKADRGATLFGDAITKAVARTNDLAATVKALNTQIGKVDTATRRMESAIGRFVGREVKNAAGEVTSRTGMVGLEYSVKSAKTAFNAFSGASAKAGSAGSATASSLTSINRAIKKAEGAISRVSGEVVRDPVTGKIRKRTGLRGFSHDVGSVSSDVRRFGRHIDSIVGHEIVDKTTGAGTGHYTGIRGLAADVRSIGTSFTNTKKQSAVLYDTFKRLVGENKVNRDPITGAVTGVSRSGAKGLIHSFDAVSKAAKGAAKNLQAIAKMKASGAPGGPGGGGGGGVPPTWFEKQLKSMKTGERSFGALGDIMKRANFGNIRLLDSIAGSLGQIGHLVGMISSGPLGIAAGGVAVATKYLGMNMDWQAAGKQNIDNLYRYKKRADASLVDTDRVDNRARDMLGAYVVRNEDGTVNAKATDEAARWGELQKSASFEESLALFETRGMEAPWMTALANQGIDYTKVRSKDDLLQVLSDRYRSIDPNDKNARNQWKTLMHELGSAVDENDLKAVTFKGGKFKNADGKEIEYKAGYGGFKLASSQLGSETLYQAGMVGDKGYAETAYMRAVTQGSSGIKYNADIRSEQVNVATALGKLSVVIGDGRAALASFSTAVKDAAASTDDMIDGLYNLGIIGGKEEKKGNPVLDHPSSGRWTPFLPDSVIQREKAKSPVDRPATLTSRDILNNVDWVTKTIVEQPSQKRQSNQSVTVPVSVNIQGAENGGEMFQAERFHKFLSGALQEAITTYMQSPVK